MSATFDCRACDGKGWRTWRPSDPPWSDGGETFDVCLSRLCEACDGTGIVVSRINAGLASPITAETPKFPTPPHKDSVG